MCSYYNLLPFSRSINFIVLHGYMENIVYEKIYLVHEKAPYITFF